MNCIEKIQSLKGQVAYCNEVLNAGGLQDWEAKEYAGVIERHTEEIARLEEVVAAHPDLF